MTNRRARPWEIEAVSPPCKSELLLATLHREALQDRIVQAFRASLMNGVSGPAESDLRAFASCAIAEMRAAQALGHQVDRCLPGTTDLHPALAISQSH